MQTIKLDQPIEASGATLTELRMRAPKVKDMRLARKTGDEADQEVNLFANLCEVTPGDIDNLSLPDYAKLQKAFKGFTKSAGK